MLMVAWRTVNASVLVQIQRPQPISNLFIGMIKLKSLVKEVSNENQADSVLLIPYYEEGGKEEYPGGIKPGYYNEKELIQMILQHAANPEAIYFIADMLDSGDPPAHDKFGKELRKYHKFPGMIRHVISQYLMGGV